MGMQLVHKYKSRAACESLLNMKEERFQMNWQDNCVVLLGVFSFLVQEAAWEKTVLG